MEIKFVYLNGDVPAARRKTIIDRFRQDTNLRIFLSTDAGGVGVNLQKANILINVDLPWNPAVLEQRIGRIYRLGQKKKIQVFNFISAFSIEHRIYHLLEFKKTLFEGVLDEHGKDEVMSDGFLKSVRSLLNVDLEQKVEDLSYHTTKELKTNILVAEEKGEYMKTKRNYREENDWMDVALAEKSMPIDEGRSPWKKGSAGDGKPDYGKGFIDRISHWFKSFSRLFNRR